MSSTDDRVVEQLVITAAAISVAVNSAGSTSSQPNSDESSKWRRAARIDGLE